jgi:2,3-bisphosphoglycerate-dependent phosphoglycerate mutase
VFRWHLPSPQALRRGKNLSMSPRKYAQPDMGESIDPRAESKGRTSLVLLRHGSSVANEGDRFGGWEDTPLSELGVTQARLAGKEMKGMALAFDIAFTSRLDRAASTLVHCLQALGQSLIPCVPDWRLNERHYGILQGMSRREAENRFGAERVRLWRRSFRGRPPQLAPGDVRDSFGDPRYTGLDRSQVPLGESLEDTKRRVSECWIDTIQPALKSGRSVLVVAHGNSLRALLMILEGIGEAEIPAVEVPNAVPIVYDIVSNDSLARRRQLPHAADATR